MKPIGASEVAKHYGLKSLNEACRLSNVARPTMNHWFKHKRQLFECVILGCVQLKIMGAKAYGNQKIED